MRAHGATEHRLVCLKDRATGFPYGNIRAESGRLTSETSAAVAPDSGIAGRAFRVVALKKIRSRPVSRVLSRTIIHLGCASPHTSSDLPGSTRGPRVRRRTPLAPLFGLAPSGVCRATECCHRRGALLPHPFTLTVVATEVTPLRRFAFCCTVRGLTPPRRYLALCPWSPDFPPRINSAAIVWPTPGADGGHWGR
jgi:hypothetical protein